MFENNVTAEPLKTGIFKSLRAGKPCFSHVIGKVKKVHIRSISLFIYRHTDEIKCKSYIIQVPGSNKTQSKTDLSVKCDAMILV